MVFGGGPLIIALCTFNATVIMQWFTMGRIIFIKAEILLQEPNKSTQKFT